ncbi:MAG: hypothetical protein HN380_17520 [Victivallales bacterium]|jgi:hypothetical protein|nr:hypothetical protein [Victivallales bacterium]
MHSPSHASPPLLLLLVFVCSLCPASMGRTPPRPPPRQPQSRTSSRWRPRSTTTARPKLPSEPISPEFGPKSTEGREIPTDFGSLTYGFVLRNGEDLPPPFDFSIRDGRIWLNGEAICEVDDADAPAADLPFDRWQEVGETPLLARYRVALADYGLLVLEPGEKPCLVDRPDSLDALVVLVGNASADQKLRELEELMSDGARGVDWASVVATLTPSPGLNKRLDLAVSCVESMTGQRRTGRRVLLVSGLCLTILALGGLFLFRPAFRDPLPVGEVASRTALVCVGLLAALNLYDLVATMQTCVPGGVIELNPLAKRMLGTPLLLPLSKLGAVGGGCAIIWRFRQRRVAVVGAWWLSMAYTVVVFHWTVCQYVLLV